MRDILSLTGGQPLAGQIRSQRICHSVAALQGSNEPCPKGPTRCVVQHASVLSCNLHYLGYSLQSLIKPFD
ncbi:hypothetical protein E4659_06080 [Dickeya dianthicola]|uniref:Uncharacterized protein n=1 Tax=Dickeya dianthicola TaxID=204039 RepID=A0AAX1C628_9GAMM|nr:hypothetical protein [Dickeya dianthicola]MZG32947.1 hypothetical protein [Dickeya dianthicola]MZG41754.1 hypothetical protein [Dickeya dianthicola]MZH98536.1 hypothetical protein [Dickeya dianthicola]MZI89252.1 hypothetical protein [Dickeya dianthicola]